MTTPVNMVDGIGPKTVEFLKKRRITTVEGLVKRGISVLETAPGFSPGRAATVLKVAIAVLDGTYVAKKSKPATKTKVKTKPEKSGKKDKKEKKKEKDKKSKDKKGKKEKKKDRKKNKKNKK